VHVYEGIGSSRDHLRSRAEVRTIIFFKVLGYISIPDTQELLISGKNTKM
jgi:hypothetical protein